MPSAVIRAGRGYPAMPLSTTGAPEVRPPRSSRTRGSLPRFSCARGDRDRTVSRRSEPSSRTALNGEQPYPWDLLQPQDAMSRHRGAKPCRRCGLLGKISLLSRSTFYPLSDGPPTRSRRITRACFAPARLVGLAVKPACTLAFKRTVCRPSRADLRAPPLPFGRRPPQSNCPPGTVPPPAHGRG